MVTHLFRWEHPIGLTLNALRIAAQKLLDRSCLIEVAAQKMFQEVARKKTMPSEALIQSKEGAGP